MQILNVIKHFGSKENLAHHSGVSVSTIRRWIKSGEIPMKEQIFLQWKTDGALKADKEAMTK